MSPENAVLEAQGLCAGYPRARQPALCDVSLELHAGEFLAVLGPNGAGKSTLVKALTGLLAPSSGSVRLFGTELSRLSRQQVARHLAVVPQQVQVCFGFTVREVVLMGRAPHQGRLLIPSAHDHAVVDEVLARTDLDRLADRPVQGLSGGEQKRVAIARALAQQPSILVLDEATAHLDIQHTVELHALVRREVRDNRVACLAVMHDLNEAAQNASRVMLLDRGRVRAIGTVQDVMTYRLLRDTFGVDLYVGVNEIDGTRYFIPMRRDDAAKPW